MIHRVVLGFLQWLPGAPKTQRISIMSSLKSGALLSLFSGFSFEGVQRVPQKRETCPFAKYPSPADVAYAARFSAPSQVTATRIASAEAGGCEATRLNEAA
jgi:hypothetical protein